MTHRVPFVIGRERSSRTLTNDFLMIHSVVGSNDYIRVHSFLPSSCINRSCLTETFILEDDTIQKIIPLFFLLYYSTSILYDRLLRQPITSSNELC